MRRPPESGAQCGDCTKFAEWVRRTQFAGDHYFCDDHAREQEDFGKEDPSYFFWGEIEKPEGARTIDSPEELQLKFLEGTE